MQVREATAHDNATLCDLIASIGISAGSDFALDRSPDFAALLRRRGESRTFLAQTERGAPLGLVTALWHGAYFEGRPTRVGEIVDLRVVPAARHTRAAFALLDAACRALRQADTDWLTCLIGDENDAAKTLVQRGGRWPRLVPLTRYASVHYPAWRIGRYPNNVSELMDSDKETVAQLQSQCSARMELAPIDAWTWPQPHTRGWYSPSSKTAGLIVSDVGFERRIRLQHYATATLPLVFGSHLMALLKRGVALPKTPGPLRLWATRWIATPNETSAWLEPHAVSHLVTAAIHEAVRHGVHVVQVNVPADGTVFRLLPRLPRTVFWSTLYGLPWKAKDANTWRNTPGTTYFADLALI